MRILILGATGMLGHVIFNFLIENSRHEILATVRNAAAKRFFRPNLWAGLIHGVDVRDERSLIKAIDVADPQVIINCIGIIKQRDEATNSVTMIQINSLLPHILARECVTRGARLIHMSTDCVFSGKKGSYIEEDQSDAADLYGQSKYIGEIRGSPTAITLRTSIIGHELNSALALVDWFLTQKGPVNGFRQVIYSGLPTIELARVIKEYVLPFPKLSGLYHVACDPISKHELLQKISQEYENEVELIPVDVPVIDRTLDGTRFQAATGYRAPTWEKLICAMRTNDYRVTNNV